ncbi:choice-of-anchor B family protein [Algicola sagamiensis]|uniref:choice-of-anchor B family protein n=1 Tax=Algicola sagamiensis TaxID=163869 RepID=UPI00037D5E41|nr:choice-of-anchor B family protein [Algicola sagamiensis]
MTRASLALTAVLPLIFFTPNILAHSEHGKPKYVAPDGIDKGNCAQAETPCKTIQYAVTKANKGDRIILSAGTYKIQDTDTLLHLLSEIVPIQPGYDIQSQYRTTESQRNVVTLVGIPPEYIAPLARKGFDVIVDQKSKDTTDIAAKMTELSAMKEAQRNITCENGKAGQFTCKNIDLVSHVPLSEFEVNPSAASDIWGHHDLNNGREYAIIGLRNGVGIVDVSTPDDPKVVTSIPSQSTTWRDIKVYQYYDKKAGKWFSYAYVTADAASVGMMIIDLNKLPSSADVIKLDTTDIRAHNIYLSNVEYGLNVALDESQPYLHLAGMSLSGGAFNTYALNSPAAPTLHYRASHSNRSEYSHDVSSLTISDSRKSQCSSASDYCEIFMDFNEEEIYLWDKSNNASPNKLSTTTYTNASYVHSGWWSEDRLMMLVHDELDESNHGLNTTLRIFDMSDLTNPKLIKVWQGPTKAIDHNGFVRGNRYYMSNYARGLTVLDITDPENTYEAAHFDTYPPNDNTSFNGAWGVYPYLPSGNILVSDIQGGLYVLKEQAEDQSKLSFSKKIYQTARGNTLEISVNRTGSANQAITVGYEAIAAGASTKDYSTTKGTLSWAANDSEPKRFTIQITPGLNPLTKRTFVLRLFNPQNGARLTIPNLATVEIKGGMPQIGRIEVQDASLRALETNENAEIQLSRLGGSEGAVTVNWQVEAVSATLSQDFSSASGTLQWSNGDSESKRILLPLVNDSEKENAESLKVHLSTPSGVDLSDKTVLVTIADDESNTAPKVTASVKESNNLLTFSAVAEDDQDTPLTYQWKQISGPTISPDSLTKSSIHAVYTGSEDVQFQVTVFDEFGIQANSQVAFNAQTRKQGLASDSDDSGLFSQSLLINLMILLGLRQAETNPSKS